MSLSELNLADSANRGAVLTVLHPVDRVPLKQADGTEITIRLLGMDSDEFIKADRRSRAQAVERMTKRQKYNPADDDARDDKSLAACTIGWSGIPRAWLERGATTDDAPAEFSTEAAVKLYSNPGVKWLREQVNEFIGDRANFLKAS